MRSRLLLALMLLLALPPAARSQPGGPQALPENTSEALPRLQIDPRGISVSGLSSGGFFAHQFHVAFSSVVKGAAILAGGPYRCVEGVRNPWGLPPVLHPTIAAVTACTHTSEFGTVPLDPRERAARSHDLVQAAFRAGAIDDPANLADDRVWIFRGEKDEVVPEPVTHALERLYDSLGVKAVTRARGELAARANHGLPVVESSVGCGRYAPPFLIDCDVDAASVLLRRLHAGPVRRPVRDPERVGSLRPFDQTPFTGGRPRTSMGPVGFVYVPDACRGAPCRLHVAFHGCRQHVGAVGDRFVRGTGYNAWAAAHRVVVLYPQTAPWDAVPPILGNPRGCWDFWGFSDPDYWTRTAPQMRAVRAMIAQLRGE